MHPLNAAVMPAMRDLDCGVTVAGMKGSGLAINGSNGSVTAVEVPAVSGIKQVDATGLFYSLPCCLAQLPLIAALLCVQARVTLSLVA